MLLYFSLVPQWRERKKDGKEANKFVNSALAGRKNKSLGEKDKTDHRSAGDVCSKSIPKD